MTRETTETLIIGAGPAGMATAMELSKAGKAFIVVDVDAYVGGLSKTYTYTESDGSVFHTDNGPHRFFSKNPYLYEFIGDLLKDDWILVNRQTRQFIDGKFYDYPINAIQAFKNIGPVKAARMIIDYVIAKWKYGVMKKPVTNFEDYVVANFGRTLGEFNMINYTEKIWGIPSCEIHPDWAKQRIKGLNLRIIAKDTILRLLGKKGAEAKSLVEAFYYPKKGTGQIYEEIKRVLEHKGYAVHLSTWPTQVRKTAGGFVTTLKNAAGEEQEIESKYLVESVPIVEFVRLLESKVPHEIESAVTKLRYRSQVYLFVTLDKPSVTQDQWIYVPEKNIPIGRISEMKNFSAYMSPADKTSLFLEFFCFEGDRIWDMTPDELFEEALKYCEHAGFFTRKEVRAYYRIAKKNVYPIYDLAYKEYLNVIKNYLSKIENLFFIGRPGRFRYNNQDHSLEMGILAAKSIIDGKVYDIESVGEEKEYQEAGKVYVNTSTSKAL
jgi:protoporphyrinogen oxidase